MYLLGPIAFAKHSEEPDWLKFLFNFQKIISSFCIIMLGETALELIRETIRSQDMLEPYNEEKVRSVLDEIKALYDQVLGN